MDMIELKSKISEKFNWATLLDSLPTIAVVTGVLLVVDKLVDIGVKLEPLYKKVENWNKDGLFEIIDTVGDNVQLVDLVLKAVGINLNSNELDRLADGLQNLGTLGKHLSTIWDLIAPKLRRASGKKFGSYRDL